LEAKNKKDKKSTNSDNCNERNEKCAKEFIVVVFLLVNRDKASNSFIKSKDSKDGCDGNNLAGVGKSTVGSF